MLYSAESKETPSRVLPPSRTTHYFKTCHEELKKAHKGSQDGKTVWIKKGDGTVELFMRSVQLFSDEPAMNPKSIELVAYSVRAVLLNF